ncbi:MAG: tetratricopeptide repeat protein [Pseudomonadota bacterium]
MNDATLRRRALAAALMALVSAAVAVPPAFAQSSEAEEQATEGTSRAAAARQARERARGNRGQEQAKKAETYPEATRKSPDAKATAKGTTRLQKMMKAYDAAQGAEARAIADEVIADDKANAYERAFAAQIAAQVAYEADDAKAADYLNKALAFDGLDNNGHYGAMLMLAQLQLQNEKYNEALATFDRFFAETKSAKPEHLVLKGNVLYRLERYPEAITVLRQAIDGNPEARADWQQLLMAAYAESGQAAEAMKLAETIAAKTPKDKRAQLNLAAIYLQSSNYAKAAEVLERLRAGGQLTEDRDYRQLYSVYLNLEGKEREAATVIDEGLQKGVLKGDFNTYLALAQSYYFSEQMDKAIGAYQKAAPLDDDGETYLNLARALWAANRIGEAKQAAQQAIAKGLKKPDDAKRILALPGK